jgi:hypothetical protein
MEFKSGDWVCFHSTASCLDGNIGKIVGHFGNYPEIGFYIVVCEEINDDFGSTAIVMSGSCLRHIGNDR